MKKVLSFIIALFWAVFLCIKTACLCIALSFIGFVILRVTLLHGLGIELDIAKALIVFHGSLAALFFLFLSFMPLAKK